MTENHESTVLQAIGDFAKKMYQILARQSDNLIFSPISIHAGLAMVSQGAYGSTKDDFLSTLKVPNITIASEGYYHIINHLNSIENVTLVLANKIYVKNGQILQPSFRDTVVNKFLSDVESINFKNSVEAADSINKWVRDKTNNKINNLMSPQDFDDLMLVVLLNVIYFKGDWKNKFNPELTQIQSFYITETQTVDVNMMSIKNKFYFKEDCGLEAKVLEMPYLNEELSMILLLPNKRNGLRELEQKLDTIDLVSINDDMELTEVEVALPQFKIEVTLELNSVLTELGLGKIFTPEADLTGVNESHEPLYISKVIQKAFIEVNEEGAEAAAATGLTVMFCSLPPPPEQFFCNHPFIVILKLSKGDNQWIPLFQGHVISPA